MGGYEHAGCRLERLPTSSWAVTFPDGLIGFYATEARARAAAERWRGGRGRVDALGPGGDSAAPTSADAPADG
jgi:hypothetical protein